MTVTGIGETVLDIVFKHDKPQAAVPGGSTFNALISLGRTLGVSRPDVPIRMVSEIGDDHVADLITRFMAENHVDASCVLRRAGSQSHISLAFLDERNDAHYAFYKDHAHANLPPEALGGVAFAADDFVLFGSYFAVNPVIRGATRPLLLAAREAGALLYYDINFRKPHVRELPQILPSLEENCRLSDVVRGSSEDFGYLFGTEVPEEIYREHVAALCPRFICTCGAGPVHVFVPGMHLTIPVEPVETVSTIGAGDSFNAGFLYGLAEVGMDRRSLADLSEDQWTALVGTACRFSAAVCRSLSNYVDPDFR